MSNLFMSIYNYLRKHTLIRISICVSAFIILGILAYQIRFEEDIYGFIPNDSNRSRINFVNKNINIADKIVVRIMMSDSTKTLNIDECIMVTEYFLARIDSLAGTKYIKDIQSKIDMMRMLEISQFLTNNMPYFMTETDYSRLDSILTARNIRSILMDDKRILVSEIGMIMKTNLISDPLHITTPIVSSLRNFNISDKYQLINDYIFTSDEKEQLVFITSAFSVGETAKNAELVKHIDSSIATTESTFGGEYKITYFGAAPMGVTNATQIKKDSYFAIILSIILMFLLLWYAFRSFKSMLLIAFPLLFGILFSIAILMLVKGTVSAIAIGASSIIIGIAINYPLHFLIHQKHSQSVKQTVKDLASPLIIGNITTVVAFLSLLYISADAMRDFGMFAAFMLIGTISFVLIFLPHFVSDKHPASDIKITSNYIDRFSSYSFEKNNYLIISIFVVTALLLIVDRDPVFETDMQKINYITNEQRKDFIKLKSTKNENQNVIYHVYEGKDINAALRNYESGIPLIDSLIDVGLILKSVGVGLLLPTDSTQITKINRWNAFWKDRREETIKNLIDEGVKVGFKDDSFRPFINILNKNYKVESLSYFEPIISNLLKDYLIDKDEHAAIINMIYTDTTKLAKVEEILNTADSEHSFVYDVGGIAQKLVDALSDDFNYVLYICGFVVFIFLTISFGRLELGIIAFIPLAVSWIWILGIMNLLGLNFNIVNIILATFIFGQGDDYAIFMTEGKIHEYAYRRKILSSYKGAVAISFLTMLIGIGTLIFAKHPAMKSLAEVTIIGMGTVVLMTYVIPPFMFNLVTTIKGRQRHVPITFVNLGATAFSFIVFLIGSTLLAIYGFFLLTICGKTDANRLKFHRFFCTISKIAVHGLPRVKTTIHNKYGEIFNTPAVIISNHQSHLDLVLMLMLNPKIVVITNKWVWNSPFYGKVIRYADFYPISDGIDNIATRLIPLVKNGYSILIFPEGTRSRDSSINRFHKGAFYLAEKLNIDILPVIVHGVGTILSKNEFILQKGKIDVFIGKRIRGIYSKDARRYYLDWYDTVCKETETMDYFSGIIYSNYIYKGLNVEWHLKRSHKTREKYATIISNLPECGNLLICNCGYGIFALTCALMKRNLHIMAIDTDADKIDIARNCISVPSNLKYGCAETDFEKYDLIIDLNKI